MSKKQKKEEEDKNKKLEEQLKVAFLYTICRLDHYVCCMFLICHSVFCFSFISFKSESKPAGLGNQR